MIVTKDNQRHYATSWQYNSARILTRLAQLVTAQGGKVKPLHPAVLSDHNLEDACTATQRRLEYWNKLTFTYDPDERQTIVSKLQHKLARFQSIPNLITVTHTSYISFVMNGFYYSFSLDDNPFFPFYYMKTPIENGTYSGDACVENASKSWAVNALLGFGCPQSEIETAAQAILALLLAAPLSTLRHDTQRIRVPNTYDSGSHLENVPVKERRLKIDF